MVGFLLSGSPMHINTIATSTRTQEGTEQIAALRIDTNEGHIAEHIRAMVAATMGHLCVQGSDATKNDAVQWQRWALGVADGIELPTAP